VPGRPGVERWVGLREGGELVAVGANAPISAPVPHLASIATLPALRGRGLGAAVTAALTRSLLAEGHSVVTLGMYSDNPVARRVYERLGFRCDHRFSSRTLAPAASVEDDGPISFQPLKGPYPHDHQ
jgi:predicted GNAT family acetyltransferase